jgi:hypothetical protein
MTSINKMDTEKKDSKEIKVRISKIYETSFFIDLPLLKSDDIETSRTNFDVEVGFSLPENVDGNTFEVKTNVRYHYLPKHDGVDQAITPLRKKVLELSTSNLFEFDDLKVYFSFEEGGLEDKFNVLPILLNVSIGSLRGYLVAKTIGTCLSNYPLPIINIETFLKSTNETNNED